MHFDIAHAAVSAVLILATIFILRRTGIVPKDGEKRWDWKLFFAVFAVMAVFNLIWPYDGMPYN